MSRGIAAPEIQITGRQDVSMLCAILDRCKDGGVPVAGLQLHLNGASNILDGNAIDFDSNDFSERVRVRSFDKFVRSAFSFLLSTRMCALEKRHIDAGIRAPMEFEYVKVTSLGKAFLGLPFVLQWSIVKTLSGIFFSIAAIKKYRWIFSVVSVTTALLAWIKAHDITGTLVAFAIVIGLAAAIAVAWIAHILGLDGNDA